MGSHGPQTFTRATQPRDSTRYRVGDSVVYHQSLFLKKLSHKKHEDKHHKSGWRHKLGELLESKPEQIFIFSIIVLDLLVICAQLFIIEPQKYCHDHPNTLQSDPTPSPHSSSHEEDPKLALAGKILDNVSLAILCTLALEIVLMLIAFDVDFFKQPLYILDAVVIGASLTIDLYFEKEHPDDKEAGLSSTLLIFFRLWRIVRIVHGVAVSVQEKNEDTIKMLEDEVGKLVKEKLDLTTKFDYLKKRYKKLVATQEEQDEPDEKNMLTTPPITPLSSMTFESPGAPHAGTSNLENVRLSGTHKKLRINAQETYDDDVGDYDVRRSNRVININAADDAGHGGGEREVHQPLLRAPSVTIHVGNKGAEYSTFKN